MRTRRCLVVIDDPQTQLEASALAVLCGHQHVQLVLTDASTLTAAKDWGVLSSRTWRLADLGAKKSMLLAGLGWGNMPAHMVEDEIKDGRLTVIQPAGSDTVTALVLGAAYISEHSLGPAGQWMLNYLTSVASVAR
jgi:DNA-binding transcriptional LysR family regulator